MAGTLLSTSLAAGVELKVVQDMMGHASIVLTADTYTSVLPVSPAPPPNKSPASSSRQAASSPAPHAPAAAQAAVSESRAALRPRG